MSRVLLIDDHAAIGTIVRAYLNALGWESNILDVCPDVDSAVDLMKAHQGYSAVLLDHSVPPTFNFRQSLKLMEEVVENTPVILFTGLLPPDFGQELIDNGVAAVLEKDELSPGALENVLLEVGLDKNSLS